MTCTMISVMHTKHGDIWTYVTFVEGRRFQQFLRKDGQVESVFAGMRATRWKETYTAKENVEIWRFDP